MIAERLLAKGFRALPVVADDGIAVRGGFIDEE